MLPSAATRLRKDAYLLRKMYGVGALSEDGDKEEHGQDEQSKGVAAATIVAVSVVTFSSAALAAPPDGLPNSGASHNCVATTSGILFYNQRGIHLGPYVKQFAVRGEQAQYVQDALDTAC